MPHPETFYENTKTSTSEAFRRGASHVEIDLQLLADDQIVVFHDLTMNCWNSKLGRTPVAELSSDYIRPVDLNQLSQTFDGTRLQARDNRILMFPEMLQSFEGPWLIHPRAPESRIDKFVEKFDQVTNGIDLSNWFFWGTPTFYEKLKARRNKLGPLLYSHTYLLECIKDFRAQNVDSKDCVKKNFVVASENHLSPSELLAFNRWLRQFGSEIYLLGSFSQGEVDSWRQKGFRGVIHLNLLYSDIKVFRGSSE